MTLSNALLWVELFLAVSLSVAILLQRTSESGLGSTGGGDTGGTSYYTKRGFERGLFIATIVLGALFVVSSLFLFAQG
jgi:protein translocase SecG subunit